MCKLFGIVEIENEVKAERFAKKAIPLITRTDDDGLGIMRLGERGVHIQRWLEPPTVVRRKKSIALQKYDKALRHQQNEAGRRSRNLYAIGIHGRFATCAKSLENTHPFYRNGAALMHNGIITNAAEFPHPLSTCDSEALLSQYLKHDVVKNPARLTNALDGVGGYYAAIVFNDNGVIDIFRDESATLHMAHVRGVGVVIATTADIIVSTAKKCKAYITGIDEILPGAALRWTNGRDPRISAFESNKPVTIITPKGDDIIDRKEWWKKQKESDRLADELEADYYRRRGWDDLTEEEWQDKKALEHLQGIKKEGV